MKISVMMIVLSFCLASGAACTKPSQPTAAPAVGDGYTNPPPPADGEYFGRGKITKIDLGIGSVELDHEAVPGLMPAMVMEFYVSDKALLSGTAVGDKVEFTILYKAGVEKITKLGKAK